MVILLYVAQKSFHLSNLFYQPPPPSTFLNSSSCLPHPTEPDNLHHPCISSVLFPVYIIVTVQICLSHSAKRTGTGTTPVASVVKTCSAADPQQIAESSKASMTRKGGAAKAPCFRKTPNFSLQLRKPGSLSSYSPLDTPSYRSPIKSPSQYFQICY